MAQSTKRSALATTPPSEGPLAKQETEVAAMFGGSDVYQVPTDAPLPQAKIMRESGQFEMPNGEMAKSFEGHVLLWHEANCWLPKKHVLFAGDHFYKSWPNLYAIRGTMYRDIRAWADSVDLMLQEEPDFLVPGHTRPIAGKERINEVLTDYRDAINFVFDKTIEGMNTGMTPDELVDYVKLPARLTEKDYLREYYGNIEWAVRQIFNAHLGWFDGNPTNLFSLGPKEEASRMAKLAGGEEALRHQAKQAIESGDYQWAAQLADHLMALNPDTAEPKLTKAEALEALAEQLLTATGRNYYLTVAQELRQAAEK